MHQTSVNYSLVLTTLNLNFKKGGKKRSSLFKTGRRELPRNVFLYKICAAQCMDLVTNWYNQQWICRTVYNNSIGECTKVIPVLRLVNRPNVIQYHFPTKRRFFVINFRLCKEQIWHCNIVFSRFVESVNMYIQWNGCFNIVGNLITCYLHRFSLSSINQLQSLWSHI